MDQEIRERFDALDSQIKVIVDAITTNAQSVDVLQAEFAELRQGRSGFTQPFRAQIENLSHVPPWLIRGDAVWVSPDDLVTVATAGSGRA